MEVTKGNPEAIPDFVDCIGCKARVSITMAWVLPPEPEPQYLCEFCAVKRGIACSTCRCFLQTAEREWYYRSRRTCTECSRICCESCARSWTVFFPDERKDETAKKLVAGDPKYYCPTCTRAAVEPITSLPPESGPPTRTPTPSPPPSPKPSRACPSFLACIFGK